MERHPKVNPPVIARCPHCGNNVQHVVKHREDFSEVIELTKEGMPIYDDCWLATLVCTTCEKPSIYKDEWDAERDTWTAKLAYPAPLGAPEEVPLEIREAFDEAVTVFQQSPSLAAVGIRRCLEGICDDQNAQGRTLAQRIQYLGTTGAMPKTLGEMMDAGREFGNIGAHFGKTGVRPNEVKSLIEFTLAIFEYVYVAPAKIEAVRRRLKARQAEDDNP